MICLFQYGLSPEIINLITIRPLKLAGRIQAYQYRHNYQNLERKHEQLTSSVSRYFPLSSADIPLVASRNFPRCLSPKAEYCEIIMYNKNNSNTKIRNLLIFQCRTRQSV